MQVEPPLFPAPLLVQPVRMALLALVLAGCGTEMVLPKQPKAGMAAQALGGCDLMVCGEMAPAEVLFPMGGNLSAFSHIPAYAVLAHLQGAACSGVLTVKVNDPSVLGTDCTTVPNPLKVHAATQPAPMLSMACDQGTYVATYAVNESVIGAAQVPVGYGSLLFELFNNTSSAVSVTAATLSFGIPESVDPAACQCEGDNEYDCDQLGSNQEVVLDTGDECEGQNEYDCDVLGSNQEVVLDIGDECEGENVGDCDVLNSNQEVVIQ